MSPNFCIFNNLLNLPEYARTASLHLYPHNPTIIKYRISCAFMISNCYYWNTKPAYTLTRSFITRRHSCVINSCPYYHWNNQSFHPTYRPRRSTNSEFNRRALAYSTYCNSSICFIALNTNSCFTNNNSTILTNIVRSSSCYNSSLCFCPSIKPVSTRKRLMAHQAHAYHIVDPSPWPLTGAIAALLITSGLAIWFHFNSTVLITIGLILLLLTIIQWWRDIIREGTFQGHHTPPVQKGLRYGIILFITSEVFFFLGFFWAFYHASLAPTPELGGCWPPSGVITLDPFEVPLLNTAVLLASGVTVTWAHHSIIEGDRKQTIHSLTLTILLGFYFTFLQAIEYYEAPFTIADGVYGSTFFVATGFHGLHVIIGSTFLAVCLIRQIQYHFTSEHHFGFEAAAWYWHFVDVVWLFLYVSIYWWGSYLFSTKSMSDFQSPGLG